MATPGDHAMPTNEPNLAASCIGETHRSLRAFVLVMGILNVLGGVLVATVLSFANGMGMLGVVDRYRYLDVNGVIDHERLGELLGEDHVENWTLTSDWLFEDFGAGVGQWNLLMAVGFFAVGLAHFAAWVLTRPKRTQADSPPSAAIHGG